MSQCKFLLSLVNDTLDYAQLKQGKFKLHIENVNLDNLLNELEEAFKIQLDLNQKVELKMLRDPSFEPVIETDVQRLKQVLINLFRNSQKFTK